VRPTATTRLLSLAAALSAAALFGACPLPQPLPGVGSPDAGLPITPPRVVTSSAVPVAAVTPYGPPAACSGGALFDVSANVIDENAGEPVEVRWFVDYEPTSQVFSTPFQVEVLPPPQDPKQFLRVPAPLAFRPSDFDVSGTRTHVVEMAISNGFLPLNQAVPAGGQPNREPAPGYEVQVFRWVFEPSPTGGCGP
jgi:hypothetical protein